MAYCSVDSYQEHRLFLRHLYIIEQLETQDTTKLQEPSFKSVFAISEKRRRGQ